MGIQNDGIQQAIYMEPSSTTDSLAALVAFMFIMSNNVLAGDDMSAASAAAAPQIGLALSGGGARGIAHVGVLKVL
jgi:hypothetical protein